MMNEMRSVHVRIEGRVQGVGYRAWLEAVATDHDLSGWVRNRRDGTVEAVLHGPSGSVAQVLEQCRRGPLAAHVTRVGILDEPADLSPGFRVLPTA